MEIKKVKISDLKAGPIRHTTLPDELIKRIKAFKQILTDVEKTSLEQTIDGFQRDMHPKNEIKIWEHIASVYQSYILEKAIKDLAIKKEVFSVVLRTSMGMEAKDFNKIKLLNKEQIENIIYNYNPTSLEQII